jgi:DNA-binding IclR family transcriptional regulator
MSQDLVKSAARALEILELFAAERRRMNSAQLAAQLGYPKSSLSVLLKSLVAQGYLACGNGDQEYFPTLKLARLGDWIPAALLGSDALLPMLEKLRDETGETVTLTMAADLHMRCLHALIGTHPISLQVEEGVSFPMVGTAIGNMYLATLDNKAVATTLARWARLHPGQTRASLAKIDADIAAARSDNVTCAYDIVMPDTGAIAMPVRPVEGGEALIVAVAGLNRRIHQKEAAIIQAMRKFVRNVP